MLVHERASCSEKLKCEYKGKKPSVYHKSGQEKIDTTFNKNQVEQKPIEGFGGKQYE